ncbi:NAD(P)-binding protein [Poronia punctata]|nr:NAD(P)-binding protein [Poronia punctata]
MYITTKSSLPFPFVVSLYLCHRLYCKKQLTSIHILNVTCKMSSSKQTRKVTIVGASGNIGAPILSALLAAGHKTSVLTRPSSTTTTTYPQSVTVHVGDYNDEAFATAALRGQDVLVLVPAHSAVAIQTPLIRAAAAAGVPYVLPCEFGSDPAHEKLNAELDLMRAKAPYRALIEDLGVGSWIGVVNNPWVEFSMRHGLYGIDLRERVAMLYDGGDVKATLTSFARVGESLAALFALSDEELARHKNSFVYLSSFRVSQRDLLASAMRVAGDEDWSVTSVSTDEVLRKARGPEADRWARLMALYAAIFKDGYGGDYSAKVVDLGLEDEELDEVMKKLVDEADGKSTYLG